MVGGCGCGLEGVLYSPSGELAECGAGAVSSVSRPSSKDMFLVGLPMDLNNGGLNEIAYHGNCKYVKLASRWTVLVKM